MSQNFFSNMRNQKDFGLNFKNSTWLLISEKQDGQLIDLSHGLRDAVSAVVECPCDGR